MASMAEGVSMPAQELSFTEDERTELERAKMMPIIFDEDCPETTPKRALRFRQVTSADRCTVNCPKISEQC